MSSIFASTSSTRKTQITVDYSTEPASVTLNTHTQHNEEITSIPITRAHKLEFGKSDLEKESFVRGRAETTSSLPWLRRESETKKKKLNQGKKEKNQLKLRHFFIATDSFNSHIFYTSTKC